MSTCCSIMPGLSALKAKPLRVRNCSCSWDSSSHPPFSIARPTLALYEPAALLKTRVAASRRLRPSSSACSSACLRTKFMDRSSSSDSAAIFTARSRRFIWLMKRSRNTPEHVTTTSMRGRPSSSTGMSSSLFTRPRLSGTGRTPTRDMTWARLSPYVLMLSVPQSVKATVSGYSPLLSARRRSMRRSTTTLAQSTAAWVGMDWGSRACMFLPVGSTSGLRMGSPPGPGVMNLPSSASTSAPSSLSATTWRRQNSRYSKSGAMSASEASGKPAEAMAFFQPEPPLSASKNLVLALARPVTSSTRPWALVERSTRARTAARHASVMRWSRSTSSSLPAFALR
mmetsp:Transcript_722/g.2427  ORF Transcript_722/g.2427 Transcript_722/m.2427 type:complete len:341 (+) Transcript_722:887-1909(+)